MKESRHPPKESDPIRSDDSRPTFEGDDIPLPDFDADDLPLPAVDEDEEYQVSTMDSDNQLTIIESRTSTSPTAMAPPTVDKTPERTPDKTPLPPLTVAPVDPSKPQVWGDFEVFEELGSGGMGAVYKGRQISLNRPVALKVLPPHLAKEESFRRRFQLEAQAVARIFSAHVVQVFAAGEHEGQLYFAMEHVKGEDLATKIKNGYQPTYDEALDVVQQAARGLVAASEFDIIHRDIKPGNLMVTELGVVKLLDFGLVKMIGNETMGLTMTGTVMGTASYFSPEQGRGEYCDQRTDIYALGVVLYQITTGQLPFGGKDPMSVIYQHNYVSPKKPVEIVENFPDSVQSIILKCLEKKPEDRYQDANELIFDIDQVKTGKSLQISYCGKSTYTLKKKKRPGNRRTVSTEKVGIKMKPRLMAVAAIVVIIVIGAILITTGTNAPHRGTPFSHGMSRAKSLIDGIFGNKDSEMKIGYRTPEQERKSSGNTGSSKSSTRKNSADANSGQPAKLLDTGKLISSVRRLLDMPIHLGTPVKKERKADAEIAKATAAELVRQLEDKKANFAVIEAGIVDFVKKYGESHVEVPRLRRLLDERKIGKFRAPNDIALATAEARELIARIGDRSRKLTALELEFWEFVGRFGEYQKDVPKMRSLLQERKDSELKSREREERMASEANVLLQKITDKEQDVNELAIELSEFIINYGQDRKEAGELRAALKERKQIEEEAIRQEQETASQALQLMIQMSDETQDIDEIESSLNRFVADYGDGRKEIPELRRLLAERRTVDARLKEREALIKSETSMIRSQIEDLDYNVDDIEFSLTAFVNKHGDSRDAVPELRRLLAERRTFEQKARNLERTIAKEARELAKRIQDKNTQYDELETTLRKFIVDYGETRREVPRLKKLLKIRQKLERERRQRDTEFLAKVREFESNINNDEIKINSIERALNEFLREGGGDRRETKKLLLMLADRKRADKLAIERENEIADTTQAIKEQVNNEKQSLSLIKKELEVFIEKFGSDRGEIRDLKRLINQREVAEADAAKEKIIVAKAQQIAEGFKDRNQSVEILESAVTGFIAECGESRIEVAELTRLMNERIARNELFEMLTKLDQAVVNNDPGGVGRMIRDQPYAAAVFSLMERPGLKFKHEVKAVIWDRKKIIAEVALFRAADDMTEATLEYNYKLNRQDGQWIIESAEKQQR